jgi:hypothetical protein
MDSHRQIASTADISNAFRSELSKISYAWKVVKELGNVADKFVESKKVTIQQVNELASSISQALQDSRQVNVVLGFVKQYLESGNLDQLLENTKKLAKTVSEQASKIDLKHPVQRLNEIYQQGVEKILKEVPASTIQIEKERKSKGLDKNEESKTSDNAKLVSVTSTINIKNLLVGLSRQETNRISHNFDTVSGSPSQAMIKIEMQIDTYQKNLDLLCHFLNDMLSLRSNYSKHKGGKISQDKLGILDNIEKKLAKTIDENMSLDMSQIYKAMHPVLIEAAQSIKKSGDLKDMIKQIITKYEEPLKKEKANSTAAIAQSMGVGVATTLSSSANAKTNLVENTVSLDEKNQTSSDPFQEIAPRPRR